MARPRNESAPTLFPVSKSPTAVEQVQQLGYCNELGKTFYDLLIDRYREHIQACIKIKMSRAEWTPIERFASEVVEAKNLDARIAVLRPEEPGGSDVRIYGHRSYGVYAPPTDPDYI